MPPPYTPAAGQESGPFEDAFVQDTSPAGHQLREPRHRPRQRLSTKSQVFSSGCVRHHAVRWPLLLSSLLN